MYEYDRVRGARSLHRAQNATDRERERGQNDSPLPPIYHDNKNAQELLMLYVSYNKEDGRLKYHTVVKLTTIPRIANQFGIHGCVYL